MEKARILSPSSPCLPSTSNSPPISIYRTMGKPPHSQSAAEPSSAPSLHSLHAFEDDDVNPLLSDDDNDNVEDQSNDKPPSYDAVFSDRLGEPGSSNLASARNNIPETIFTPANGDSQVPHPRLSDADYRVPGGRKAQSVFYNATKCTVTLEPILSHSARELSAVIAQQARLPPRPQLVINGSHTDSNNRKKNKNDSDRVIDFDFRLDLAETLLTGWGDSQRIASAEPPGTQKWHNVVVAEDHDGIKAYRGSRVKTLTWNRAKEPTNTRSSATNRIFQRDDPENNLLYREEGDGMENGSAEHERLIQEDRSSVLEWCTRFCNDPSPVKSFTLIRQVQNFEHPVMIDCLTSHIRDTNYRGQITMRLEIVNGNLTIYSPHWVNKLRNNRFIFWICIILQLWCITWPVIWLLEKRYEVVRSYWYASHTIVGGNGSTRTRRYAGGRDEHDLGEFWAPVVKQAAWGRRRYDEVILLEDAQRAEGLTTAEILRVPIHDSQAETERRQRVDRGDGTFSDSVIGFVRGLSEVRRSWNMTVGWGENT